MGQTAEVRKCSAIAKNKTQLAHSLAGQHMETASVSVSYVWLWLAFLKTTLALNSMVLWYFSVWPQFGPTD